MSPIQGEDRFNDRGLDSSSQNEEGLLNSTWQLRIERVNELLTRDSAVVQHVESSGKKAWSFDVKDEQGRIPFLVGREGEPSDTDVRYFLVVNAAPVFTSTLYFNATGPLREDSSDFETFFEGSEDKLIDEALRDGFANVNW